MKMQRFLFLLSIGLLSSGIAQAGVKDDFDQAAKTGDVGKVRSILANPVERKQLLTPETVVDRIGQSFRRAAKRGQLEVVKVILDDGDLYALLATYRSPKDWLTKARDAAKEKYPRVVEYLDKVIVDEAGE